MTARETREKIEFIADTAVYDAVRAAEAQPEGNLPEATRLRVQRLVYQDPPWRSWRVWGSVWALVTGLLALPEVQAAIQAAVSAHVPTQWLPVATAVLAVIWPMISKLKDPRPRGP